MLCFELVLKHQLFKDFLYVNFKKGLKPEMKINSEFYPSSFKGINLGTLSQSLYTLSNNDTRTFVQCF